MKKLLAKEIRLAAHPTSILFLALSAMVLIPNYPYYVTFFYTSLTIFFTCLSGRENHDIFYTVTLPVRKRDAVRARISFAVLLELVQMVLAIPFAMLRQSYPAEVVPGNAVGIEANIAFFGSAFVMLGIFNIVFFTRYYKNPEKVGSTFAIALIVEFVYMIIAESCVHAIPYLRDVIDTYDSFNVAPKFVFLAVGAVLFVLLTIVAYRISAKRFEALDL